MTQTRVNATIQDMAKSHEMIDKDNKMIRQAQAILDNAGPLRDADTAHLTKLTTVKASLQEQEQQVLQEFVIAEARIKEAISVAEGQLRQEAAANALKIKEQLVGSLENKLRMYAEGKL